MNGWEVHIFQRIPVTNGQTLIYLTVIKHGNWKSRIFGWNFRLKPPFIVGIFQPATLDYLTARGLGTQPTTVAQLVLQCTCFPMGNRSSPSLRWGGQCKRFTCSNMSCTAVIALTKGNKSIEFEHVPMKSMLFQADKLDCWLHLIIFHC